MLSELLQYTASDFADLASLMQELSGDIVLGRDALDRMLDDQNSHLYVIRDWDYTGKWDSRRKRRISM